MMLPSLTKSRGREDDDAAELQGGQLGGVGGHAVLRGEAFADRLQSRKHLLQRQPCGYQTRRLSLLFIMWSGMGQKEKVGGGSCGPRTEVW